MEKQNLIDQVQPSNPKTTESLELDIESQSKCPDSNFEPQISHQSKKLIVKCKQKRIEKRNKKHTKVTKIINTVVFCFTRENQKPQFQIQSQIKDFRSQRKLTKTVQNFAVKHRDNFIKKRALLKQEIEIAKLNENQEVPKKRANQAFNSQLMDFQYSAYWQAAYLSNMGFSIFSIS